MAQVYSVTSGKTAAAAAGSVKVAVALATGAAVQNRIVQIDVSFDGNSASQLPVLVELVKTSGAPSGGSTYTPLKVNTDARAASATTARINDTSDGSSPVIQQAFLVSPTSGVVIQFPLGREPGMTVSEFWEVRLTVPSAGAAVNYLVNVWFEE